MAYGPGDLDVLARAFDRAIDALPMSGRDPETAKTVLMTGILDAARTGERDEIRLTESALRAIKLFDQQRLTAQ